jgi:hypothetical protein
VAYLSRVCSGTTQVQEKEEVRRARGRVTLRRGGCRIYRIRLLPATVASCREPDACVRPSGVARFSARPPRERRGALSGSFSPLVLLLPVSRRPRYRRARYPALCGVCTQLLRCVDHGENDPHHSRKVSVPAGCSV